MLLFGASGRQTQGGASDALGPREGRTNILVGQTVHFLQQVVVTSGGGES